MLPEEKILVLSQLISSLKEEVDSMERISDSRKKDEIKTRMLKLNDEIKQTISSIKIRIKSI